MSAPLLLSFACSGLQRSEGTVAATRHLDTRAGAALNELPRVTLEIHRGSTLTRGARTGGAVVLSLQGDAVTLLLVRGDSSGSFGRRKRCCVGNRCEQARDNASEQGGTNRGL